MNMALKLHGGHILCQPLAAHLATTVKSVLLHCGPILFIADLKSEQLLGDEVTASAVIACTVSGAICRLLE